MSSPVPPAGHVAIVLSTHNKQQEPQTATTVSLQQVSRITIAQLGHGGSLDAISDPVSGQAGCSGQVQVC
jgi:hypothetical protein